MKIVVTGATGYIGARVVRLARSRNHVVIAATRRPTAAASGWLFFDLNVPLAFDALDGVDAVIHLAAEVLPRTGDRQYEVTAAKALITAAKKTGAKFIFVSSQTAQPEAPTGYALTKWHIEQEVLLADGWVVRPGQVYGGPERGLFGELVNFVRKNRVLPAFVPAPLIQPIHVDDLALGLLRLTEHNDIRSSLICLAASDPISFTHFLQLIAKDRIRWHLFFVPVSVSLVKIMIGFLGSTFIFKFGLYRLNSLFRLPQMNTSADLCLLKLELRSLSSGLHRSGNDRRRRLIREGAALLNYLLKRRPSLELVRRYVRMVEALRMGIPLVLPELLLRWPITVGLLDDRAYISSPQGNEFGRRIDAAMVILEASKQGADRFIGSFCGNRRLKCLASILLTIGTEILWRTLHVIVSPLIMRLCVARAS